MKLRRLAPLFFPVLILGVLPSLFAQTNISFTVGGPDYLAPDAPFTLRRTIHTETRLQTGNAMRHEVHEVLTRDPQGRLFDSATPVPDDALKQPLSTYLLGDPVANTITEWGQGRNTAVSTAIPAKARLDIHPLWNQYIPSNLPQTSVVTESLGTQQIAGLSCTGTRTTTTVPGSQAGSTDPLHFVHEVWVSDDLHIPLRELYLNPLTGSRSMNTDKVDRVAGQAILFHLPPGLDVKTIAPRPPGGIAPPRSPEQLAYNKANQDIKAPESREAAADVLVRYAGTHPELANHIAHTLAIRNTHLADARSLAESSVLHMEQATANLNAANLTPDAASEMFNLAEYWDSLGSVHAAQGDTATAERYFRAAWQLGGEGLYLDHIAQLQAEAGDKPAALHTLAVALSGRMDPRETDQVTRRAQRLGEDHPQPTPDPLTLPVPAAKARQGSAEFNLLFIPSGSAPAVLWLSGDPALQAEAHAVAAATFPPQTPDTGPEHIVRRARLDCAATGCRLTLLYAWQAEDEDKSTPK